MTKEPKKKVKKLGAATNEEHTSALTKLFEDHHKRQQERDDRWQELMAMKSNEDESFGHHLINRLKALKDQKIKRVVKMQIEQIMFNAENPDIPGQKIMELPSNTAQGMTTFTYPVPATSASNWGYMPPTESSMTSSLQRAIDVAYD